MDSGIKVDNQHHPIVFFDGVCNLCNGAVQFIIKHDKKAVFKLAPLQSNIAEKLLEGKYLQLNSIVLLQSGVVYTKSTAALKIAKNLGFPIALFYGFRIIPRFLRDLVYNFIAKHRYNWFGKSLECMIPSVETKHRFLREE